MGSIVTRSPPSKVVLIPWDPDSPEHVDRMVQQRIACGWKFDAIPKWQIGQREGRKNLQWVIIDESDPNRQEHLAKHVAAYPKEITVLADTALSLGAKPRQSDPGVTFIPVGHISLDTEYDDPGFDDPTPGVYFIAAFYISGALQNFGLGRAAMDIVETTAISQPLCAKRLALSTQDKDDPNRPKLFAALGQSVPKVTNQDWYERRGYEVYRRVERMWESEGAWWAAVFMRKDITV
ncbi:hypothetical protein EG329_002580 [Mollisiaceae sp. DMI_Dod_QoI]|nr:hypothetical protein EG329_002580 [Helotiales sp. DMI_Dod_QoI]